MGYREPTYDEYKKATEWGRIRYKYSHIALTICWISLILLCYFTFNYSQELSTHPFIFGAEKHQVECQCSCYNIQEELIYIHFNSTYLNLNPFHQNNNNPINYNISNITT